jgi:hypothetical protein
MTMHSQRSAQVNQAVKGAAELTALGALFCQPVLDAYGHLGIDAYHAGYLCGRVAPVGAISARSAYALVGLFHREHVAEAVSLGWAAATPQAITSAKYDAYTAVISATVDALVASRTCSSDALDSVVATLRHALDSIDGRSHVIAGALLDLPWPSTPAGQLLRCCEVIREHRFASHMAALGSLGAGTLDALITAERTMGFIPRGQMTYLYGYVPREAAEAEASLRERHLLDDDGNLTDAAHALRLSWEAATDANEHYLARTLTDDDVAHITTVMGPINMGLLGAGALPAPDQMTNVVQPSTRQRVDGDA